MYWHAYDGRIHLHIGVGFGVARSDYLGVPKPRDVGRVTGELPTSFVLCNYPPDFGGYWAILVEYFCPDLDGYWAILVEYAEDGHADAARPARRRERPSVSVARGAAAAGLWGLGSVGRRSVCPGERRPQVSGAWGAEES